MLRNGARLKTCLIESDALISRLLRYGAVGATVAAFYLVSYYVLAAHFRMSAPLSNFLSFAAAVFIQFLLQRRFTFRHQGSVRRPLVRFVGMVTVGYLFSVLVTSWLVPARVVPEWVGALLVVVLLPLVNALLMFLWVFVRRNEPTLQ